MRERVTERDAGDAEVGAVSVDADRVRGTVVRLRAVTLVHVYE